ncbi:hypothetical protein A2U01_0076377, partial [Trifolium medium]|nr:hypothetical protein [Trifolium medium]
MIAPRSIVTYRGSTTPPEIENSFDGDNGVVD